MSYFDLNTHFTRRPEFEILIPLLKDLEAKKVELCTAGTDNGEDSIDYKKYLLLNQICDQIITYIKEFDGTPISEFSQDHMITLLNQLKFIETFLKEDSDNYKILNALRNQKKRYAKLLVTGYEAVRLGLNIATGASVPTLLLGAAVTHVAANRVRDINDLSDNRSATVITLANLAAQLRWVSWCVGF